MYLYKNSTAQQQQKRKSEKYECECDAYEIGEQNAHIAFMNSIGDCMQHMHTYPPGSVYTLRIHTFALPLLDRSFIIRASYA